MSDDIRPKKMGRPPAIGVPRTYRAEVRMSSEEVARVRAAAADAGLDMSEYIRRRVFGVGSAPQQRAKSDS